MNAPLRIRVDPPPSPSPPPSRPAPSSPSPPSPPKVKRGDSLADLRAAAQRRRAEAGGAP